MAMDDITAIGVFLHPVQDCVAQLLVGICINDLRHEVVRLEALEVQVLLGVDLLGLLADRELLRHPQECHLLAHASFESTQPLETFK